MNTEKNDCSSVIYSITSELVDKAKAAHSGQRLIQIEAAVDGDKTFEGIFLTPSLSSFQMYLERSNIKTSNGGGVLKASLNYVIQNIVYPTRDEFYEIQKRFPALSIGLANELTRGMGIVTRSKKKEL